MTDHRNPDPAAPASPDPAAPGSPVVDPAVPGPPGVHPAPSGSPGVDRPDAGAAVPGVDRADVGAPSPDAAEAARPPDAAGDGVRSAPESQGTTHTIGTARPGAAEVAAGGVAGDLVRPAAETRGETHNDSGGGSEGGPTKDLHVPAGVVRPAAADPDERTVSLRTGEPVDEPTVPFRNPMLGGEPPAATPSAMTSAPAPEPVAGSTPTTPVLPDDATVPLAVSAFRRPAADADPAGAPPVPTDATASAERQTAAGHEGPAGPPLSTEPGASTVRLTPEPRPDPARSAAETPLGGTTEPAGRVVAGEPGTGSTVSASDGAGPRRPATTTDDIGPDPSRTDPAAPHPAVWGPAAQGPAVRGAAAQDPAGTGSAGTGSAGTGSAGTGSAGTGSAGRDPAGMDPERSLTEPDGPATAGNAVATVPAREQSAPWRRLSSAGALIWVLIALFGFTLVVQLRSNDTDQGLATTRQEDLVRILSDLEARETRLNAEIATLEDSQRQLNSGVAGREAALAEAKKRADQLGLLAGTLPGRGPGLEIRITPGGAPIKASALLNTVQELRGAGGEVMQLAGSDGAVVRVVASTSFVDGDGGTVAVDGTRLSAPFLLTVIGSPETMRTALNIPGGVVASVANAGGNVDPQPRKSVDVTALRKATNLQYARPVS